MLIDRLNSWFMYLDRSNKSWPNFC